MKAVMWSWTILVVWCTSFESNCHKEPLSLELYDRLTHPTVPTLLSFESPYKNQHLFYVGTCHNNCPDHHQYKTIDKEWDSFKKKTKLHNIVIIGELLPEIAALISYETKNEAICFQNDSGYAVWLAQQHDLTFIGAELPYKTVIQQLLQEFKKEHVHYFCFAFAADFWTQYEDKPELAPFILERVHTWTNDSSITFEYLVALHEQYTSRTFLIPERSFFFRLMTLTYHTSATTRILNYFSASKKPFDIIYPILRRCHQIRDMHTLSVIKKEWQEGKNIFIVYGALHAAALEKALHALTQQ